MVDPLFELDMRRKKYLLIHLNDTPSDTWDEFFHCKQVLQIGLSSSLIAAITFYENFVLITNFLGCWNSLKQIWNLKFSEMGFS